ncbi:MAG: RsmB/NOP family class I SAM-dependent RNA methyltransferase [Rhodocyclaceae bacterium]|nr:RsmB/NOP family class I SAM-dependent RNA methyltransferase [Rhodocyclaceae bacterium]
MSVQEGALSRAVLDQSVQVLGSVLAFRHPADGVLSRHFREHRRLGQRDRAFIAEGVYSVLRRLRWLRRLAGFHATPRQLLLAWLARGEGMSLRRLHEVLKPQERDWLAEIKAKTVADESLGERCDMPDWLVDRLLPEFGEEGLLALARSLNRPAPLDLRVNPLRAEREAVREALAGDGLIAQPCRFSPLALRLEQKPALTRHPLFVDGHIEVQDEGSQLLAMLVAPRRGELVVDFCAGAGGKTLHLGALMKNTGRLYAYDVSDRRLARLKPRLARAGLSNVHPLVISGENDARVKRLSGKADRVLVDAPCSGLGTLRRNPDLKWRHNPQSIAELATKQAAILAAAARLPKPGGRLVYATCSLLREENDGIVDAFLADHPGYRELRSEDLLGAQGVNLSCGERLRLQPDRHDCDGFFAAVMERCAD